MASQEIALQNLLNRQEISDLNTTFARALDGGTVEEFLSIFAPDVAYKSGPRQLDGHDALRDFFVERAASGRISRHMMSGIRIRIDGDTAHATSNWLVFGGDAPLPVPSTEIFLVADVTDELAHSADGWKITKRTISPVFRNAGAAKK